MPLWRWKLRSSSRSIWWFTILVSLYFLFQLPTLDQPLLETHSFRQTQTAYQVETLFTGEGSLHRPVLPVLGSPWEVPFEMPTFQASAALIMHVLDLPSDVASRSASLIWFLLCLIPFWRIGRRFLDRSGSTFALLVFLFSPISLLYSRASLIEFAAIFFSLTFIDLFLRAAEANSFRLVLLASLFAILGGVTKSTTFMPAAMASALLVIPRVSWENFGKFLAPRRIVYLLTPQIAGFVATLVWTSHADSIKRTTQTTEWLTSNRLTSWNFGTWSQRLDPYVYEDLFHRFQTYFGNVTVALLILSVPLLFKKRSASLLALVSLAGILASILVFFNLYVVHDYYFVAVLPFVAWWTGSVLSQVIDALVSVRIIPLVWVFMAVAVLGSSVLLSNDYWKASRANMTYDTELKSLVPESSYVVVAEDDWDPTLLYSNRRKGIMMDHRAVDISYLQRMSDLTRYDFITGSLVTRDLLALRGYFYPLSDQVFRIDDQIGDLRSHPYVLSFSDLGTMLPVENLAVTCDETSTLTLSPSAGSSTFAITSEDSQRIQIDGHAIPVSSNGLVIEFQQSDYVATVTCTGGGSTSVAQLSNNP